jgi:glycosyltransferase involved in cell wall biosynthesis
MWASSPDRGLDNLLEIWPKIRKEVPGATLRIFYKMKKWLDHFLNHPNPALHPTYPLQVDRAKRIRGFLDQYRSEGIEVFESVSRNRMSQEMAEATVLAYPCDTVDYTEGFSVTLMEACASGAIPVTSAVDALGSIYGGYVPMVKAPVRSHLVGFAGLVVRALTDESFQSKVRFKSRSLADAHHWDVLTEKLERSINDARRKL